MKTASQLANPNDYMISYGIGRVDAHLKNYNNPYSSRGETEKFQGYDDGFNDKITEQFVTKINNMIQTFDLSKFIGAKILNIESSLRTEHTNSNSLKIVLDNGFTLDISSTITFQGNEEYPAECSLDIDIS